ncbi:MULTISPECIES: DUF5986 family protein [Lysinibacillus]|uniref:DUF5986 family protein n=1 Tax=Lysinibacillus capsici TaxID=2115968 RepID=A0ABY8KQE7_9BACI|nr:DUF5986 family protein [Lysinibacillus capsici]WGF39906.1 DUF5986 family protein [Lysinibacillus capsici]
MEFIKDELQMKKLVMAFSQNTENTLDEIEFNYNMGTGNFRQSGSWDLRFGRIEDSVKNKSDVAILNRERGIWKYKAILFATTGTLFVFTKEKNLDKVIKEKSNTEKIHYFHALVYLNVENVGTNVQLDLFDYYDESFELRREREVQKILMEYYSQVKQVYFIVGTERNKQIVEVKVQHFNRQFEFLKEVDLSKYISKGEYEDILLKVAKNGDKPTTKPLVGIKDGLKKRNEKQIADWKQAEKEAEFLKS